MLTAGAGDIFGFTARPRLRERDGRRLVLCVEGGRRHGMAWQRAGRGRPPVSWLRTRTDGVRALDGWSRCTGLHRFIGQLIIELYQQIPLRFLTFFMT